MIMLNLLMLVVDDAIVQDGDDDKDGDVQGHGGQSGEPPLPPHSQR